MHSGPTGDTASPPARMPLFWTPKQVAEALQVTSRTVARWIESGALNAANEAVFAAVMDEKGIEKKRESPGIFYYGVELADVPLDTPPPHGSGREP